MSKEFRLGVFIVATLLILCAGVFMIGNRRSWFDSTYTVRADFPNVAGLNTGAPVRVGGVFQGTVQHIDLPKRPDQSVTVTMNLDRTTRSILKSDSVASIKAEGLLGDKYVEVSFGSLDGKPLGNGETIASEPPLEFSDLMQKANLILDSSRTTAQNAQETTDSMKSIASKIDQGTGTLGALVNNKTVYQQATAGVTALHDDMEALKHNFLLRGYFKTRGYDDPDELARHQLAELPSGPYQKKFVYDSKQLFPHPDNAKVKNQKALDSAGKFLESMPFDLAVVAVSSGMKGDTEKDRTLTEARAMIVRNYLVDDFKLDDAKVKTIGMGKRSDSGEQGDVKILVYGAR